MAKKPAYEIVEFKRVAVANLTPHAEAERVPMDAEDRACLAEMVDEADGIYLPLLVTAEPNEAGQHTILDGVNRWEALRARDAGAQAPCLLVRCADPRAVAATCLLAGRKRSTGQRVLAFVEWHREEVMAAWRVNSQKGEMFRKHSKASREALDAGEWSAEGIARRLKCSRDDARAAIEILDCLESDGESEPGKTGAAARKFSEQAAKQRVLILSGSTGVRRWRAAAAGRDATQGKRRSDPDYSFLSIKAISTLRNAFATWPTVKWPAPLMREQIAEAFAHAMAILPDELHAPAIAAIVEAWPVASRRELAKELAKAAKA